MLVGHALFFGTASLGLDSGQHDWRQIMLTAEHEGAIYRRGKRQKIVVNFPGQDHELLSPTQLKRRLAQQNREHRLSQI